MYTLYIHKVCYLRFRAQRHQVGEFLDYPNRWDFRGGFCIVDWIRISLWPTVSVSVSVFIMCLVTKGIDRTYLRKEVTVVKHYVYIKRYVDPGKENTVNNNSNPLCDFYFHGLKRHFQVWISLHQWQEKCYNETFTSRDITTDAYVPSTNILQLRRIPTTC